MNSRDFERISDRVVARNRELSVTLQSILAAQDFTVSGLNQIHSTGGECFSEFEQFLVNCSSEENDLTQSQLEDILTSIENFFEVAVTFWSAINAISRKISVATATPQVNFLNTAQRIYKNYRPKNVSYFQSKFQSIGIPIGGFVSGNKIKLKEPLIVWPTAITGLTILTVSCGIIFGLGIKNGMEYLIMRIFAALAVGLTLTGFTKNQIKISMKYKGTVITAVGAIAVFVFIYLWNPADPPNYPTATAGQNLRSPIPTDTSKVNAKDSKKLP